MIEWLPAYQGEPQLRASVGDGIVVLCVGANNNGGRRPVDGRDATGRWPWHAWAANVRSYVSGHADTLADAKRAAVAAAKQILAAALAECDDA